MKPGRELDALVAEKVMGWKVLRHKDFPDHPDVDFTKEHGVLMRTPHFSTDIAAAWEVVGKLEKSHDFELIHLIYHGMGDARGWFIKLDGNRVGFPQETAPHAICLSALKAVGYESD